MSKNKPVPTNMKENIGKVFIDLGKLMFGSFILGGVLRGEVPQYIILIAGFVGTLILLTLGLVWTSKKQKKGE
jgi:hypothetical protein